MGPGLHFSFFVGTHSPGLWSMRSLQSFSISWCWSRSTLVLWPKHAEIRLADRADLVNEGIFLHISPSCESRHGGNRLSMVDLPSFPNGRGDDEAVGVMVSAEVFGRDEDDIDGAVDSVERLMDLA